VRQPKREAPSEQHRQRNSSFGSARYAGLTPATVGASRAARGASHKQDTKPELALRRALRAAGIRGYRVAPAYLEGKPDLVFLRLQIAGFCDGDFWHGRDLKARLAKLQAGHNAPYWVAKIRGNVERDARHDAALRGAGWTVLRFWESDIMADPPCIATVIAQTVKARRDATRAALGALPRNA
jgi:DNA mismatch endonuclease (patch repair protein)